MFQRKNCLLVCVCVCVFLKLEMNKFGAKRIDSTDKLGGEGTGRDGRGINPTDVLEKKSDFGVWGSKKINYKDALGKYERFRVVCVL